MTTDEITLNYQTLTEDLRNARDPREKFEQLSIMVEKQTNVKKIQRICKDIASDIFLLLERRRTGLAIHSLRALILLVGPDEAIAQLKRSGILRASKYAFNVTAVEGLLNELVQYSDIYKFNENDLVFLNSVMSLYYLSRPIEKLYKSIVNRLVDKKKYVIKSLLAEVDSRFVYGSTSRTKGLGLSEGWSAEDVTEAYSYLLNIFDSVVGLKSQHFQYSDPEAGYSEVYPKLLNDSATICQYKESEILIESFPYEARIESKEVVVEATHGPVERHMRIGYIQSEMQLNIRREMLRNASNDKSGPASILSLAERLFAEVGHKLVHLVDTPIRRYVLSFPVFEDVAEIFKDDKVFAEDLMTLEMLGNEDYVDVNDIIYRPVIDDITVIDILKIQRLVLFLHVGLMQAIHKHPVIAEQAGLQMTSCVPVFRRQQLLQNFEQAVGKEKADKMLTLMSCDFTKEFIDLQYTPLITRGDMCMFSMAVFASSNLVRNLLVHYKKRLTLQGPTDVDPMQESLKNALLGAKFLVKDEFDPGTIADPREIDLIAYKDGHLFLIECKNSFHPCNVYERRTTYDYIKYASQQLNLRKSWLADPAKQTAAFRTLGWDVPVTTNIHTCIALGNRVYNGLILDGHPVRSVHELLNVLLRGIVSLRNEKFRLWKHDQFEVSDFIKQLGPNSTVADFSDSMYGVHRKMRIGSSALNYNSLALDFQKLDENVRLRYQLLNVAA